MNKTKKSTNDQASLTEDELLLIEEKKSIRKSRIIGCIISFVSIILFAVYLLKESSILLYTAIVLLLVGILFILPINYYIFDVKDWEGTDSEEGVIKKLRLRAIVFNNLAVLILIISIAVIVFCFYQIRRPNFKYLEISEKDTTANYLALASQIGSVIVLIFLVQILFRVFKYLIRVGGFYNGKADALELTLTNPEKNYDVYKLLESFTPQSYDISDVESPGLYPK